MSAHLQFCLPPVGEGIVEVELVRWACAPGGTFQPGQILLEILSDKASMEVPAPFAGKVAEQLAQVGQRVKIGEALFTYYPHEARVAEAPPAVSMLAPANGHAPAHRPAPSRSAGLPPAASPSVRRVARQLGIDLDQVAGSGPAGRILVRDLEERIAPRIEAAAAQARPAPADTTASKTAVSRDSFGKPGQHLPLSGIRQTIARRMLESKRAIPHYSYVDECDVTVLVQLREMLREPFSKRGLKLTYLAFMVMAAVRALKEVPMINSMLDEKAGEIVLHEGYHIGIATATRAGLIVPVLRDVNRMDLLTVAGELDRLAKQAKEGKTRRDDLGGSTFTISSIGGVGGLISTPIIHHPETAILAVGKIVKRPIYDDHGQLKAADMVYLSFSYDHRVIDGAVGAAFGNAVKMHLHHPAEMLLPLAEGGGEG